MISIVDSGISQVVSFETDHVCSYTSSLFLVFKLCKVLAKEFILFQEVKNGFLDWLNQYMERKVERRTQDIDVDGTIIVQLVSRLQAEWESSWLPEPSVPTDPDLVEVAHTDH